MIKNILTALALGITCSGVAQTGRQAQFRPPLDFPLLLSANFGELRPNHFHNGLDIKTQGVTGKTVRSVADGYVSRILVQHGGYGQAIFVTHPNGYTSLYGHVVSFAPAIQKYVRRYQYQHETFVCDLRPAPGDFPVKAGQMIALSGNEGASAGPHLHFELRRNDTGEYVDPMPFFIRRIKDTKPPVANLVGFYPVPGKGVVEGASVRKLVSPAALSKAVNAWGEIYTGISARDYMDGTSNFYGVHSVTLYVDSVKVFQSLTDRVSADENRMINGFTDYDELMRTGRLIMRSYKSPGNRLRLLHTRADRGVVTINRERDYHFCYVLEDNFGNRRICRFTVRGKKQPIPRPKAEQMLYCDRNNLIQEPGMELHIPKGMLYDDAPVRTTVIADSAAISSTYVIDAGNTPLHSFCSLAIGVRHRPVADTTKYYIVQKSGKRRASVGGRLANGWITAQVRSLGTFTVDIDTVAPRLVPVAQHTWASTRNIRFRVSDAQTGIASYKVRIDGRFVLFGLKRGMLVIQDPQRVVPRKPHHVEVTLTDACGNITTKSYHF